MQKTTLILLYIIFITMTLHGQNAHDNALPQIIIDTKEIINPQQKVAAHLKVGNYDDPNKGYARLIDVPSFIDYFIHTELSLNADGYKRSAYFYKEKQNADGNQSPSFSRDATVQPNLSKMTIIMNRPFKR